MPEDAPPPRKAVSAKLGSGVGVSFVTTVYNKRDYLPAVIEGLACQKGDFPREFVFVDDGSTDGSSSILEKLTARLSDARIFTQPNRGPSVATNRGLAAARYPLVKLVDGDDVLVPHATSVLRDALLRHSGTVLSFGDGVGYATPVEATNHLQSIVPAPPGGESVVDALPSLLRNCNLEPSICLFHRDAARAVGGCDERVFTQDYSLFLRLATQGAFIRIDDTVKLSPLRAAGRINDGGPQVLHDVNLTLRYFLSEHAVPAAVARRTARRGIKRAWYWARRRENARVLASSSWLLLSAYLTRAVWSPALLERSCAVFTASHPVRRMPSDFGNPLPDQASAGG